MRAAITAETATAMVLLSTISGAMPGMPGMAPDIVDSKTMAVAVSAVMAALMLIALWTSHLYYRNSLREKKLLQEAKEYANIILRDIVEGVIVIDEQGLMQP